MGLTEKLHEKTLVVDILNHNLVHKDEEIEKLKAKIAVLSAKRSAVRLAKMLQHGQR